MRSMIHRTPALVLLTLLLARCGEAALPPTMSAPTPTANPAALTLVDWAGYADPPLQADFRQAHPDTPIAIVNGADDEEIMAAFAAMPQADLVHPCGEWLGRYTEQDLMAVIDTSRLKNWPTVSEGFRETGRLNGQQYFVPFDWGFSSMIYRTDKIPQGIDSWQAMFDPAYRGHIAMIDHGPDAVRLSSYIRGSNERFVDDAALASISEEWRQQATINGLYWSDEAELMKAITSGDIWLAYGWQGTFAKLVKNQVPVAFANPQEGRMAWICHYGIRKDSPRYDLALAYIDGLLGETSGRFLVDDLFYGHANQQVMAQTQQPEIQAALSLNDPRVLADAQVTQRLTAAQTAAWTEMWAKVRSKPTP